MSEQVETRAAYSASWWENQSAQQLQDFVRGGLMSGDLFDGAQRELERRARVSARQIEEAAKAEIQHRVEEGNHVAFAAAGISLVAAILAILWFVIFR